ncbi:transposase [Burkholderia sp. B21-007]|uniref:transposase n=1 Tax=unclassified Burkholderia TaxID=2613784 RepID=UPI003A5CC62E
MKASEFTEAQTAFALKQAELGAKVEVVCRTLGISKATFHNRKTALRTCVGCGNSRKRTRSSATDGGP